MSRCERCGRKDVLTQYRHVTPEGIPCVEAAPKRRRGGPSGDGFKRTLGEGLHQRARFHAIHLGIPLAKFVRRAVENFMKPAADHCRPSAIGTERVDPPNYPENGGQEGLIA